MPDDVGGYSYCIESSTDVSAPITEAFAFLADPRSLPALDPPWVDARLVTGTPCDRAVGSEAEYVLRWFKIPLYLRMVVTEHEAPRRLVLGQAAGPWRSYTHSFDLRRAAGATVISERAEFRAGPGLFEHGLHRFVIRRQLRGIVGFRCHALARALGPAAGTRDRPGP